MKALLESQNQSASEERALEDDVIRSQFFQKQDSSEANILQRLKSVDKVLCTECTTTTVCVCPCHHQLCTVSSIHDKNNNN